MSEETQVQIKPKVYLLTTSQDGRQVVKRGEKNNILVFKEVGALAGERLVQFSDDPSSPTPFHVWLSQDNTLMSVVPPSGRTILIFDLSVDSGTDADGNPNVNSTPLIELHFMDDIIEGGFSAARSDDAIVIARTRSYEKAFNLTQVVRATRSGRSVI